jgi:rod shape-determining protein MreB
VHRLGDGLVLSEPAVVAVRAASGRVVAVGTDVWELIGSDPASVLTLRPLRDGTITDYEVTASMIALLLRRVGVGRLARPRVLATVPSAMTEVERRAVREALTGAGARRVVLVEEALAAAIGAGLPVHEPVGSFVVDVGGGRTEAAVVSMGGVVGGRSIRIGGYQIDDAIRDHLREGYGVAIGERAAEELKIALATAFPTGSGRRAVVIGRELATGNTVEVELTEDEVRAAIGPPVRAIVETVRTMLAEAPPELTHDVLDVGLFLTGGGSQLRGLDLLLAQECEVPVHVAERPLETVVRGAGRMLEHLEDYRATFQLVRARGRS